MREMILEKKKSEPIKFIQGINHWMLMVVLVCNVFFQLSVSSATAFKYVGLAILLVFLAFLDKDDYAYLFVSLMSVISSATFFGISILNIITIIYFYRSYIFENKYVREKDRRKLPSQLVIPCVVWILYCVQFLFEGVEGLEAILLVIKQLLFLVYMVDVFRFCTTREEAKSKLFKMEIYYVAGVIISTLMSIVVNGMESLDATRMTLNSATGINRFGVLLAFSLIFVLLEFLKAKNFKEWVVLFAVTLFLLYFCFATKSRNCILTILVSFVIVVGYGLFQRKSRTSILLLLGVLLFGTVIIMTLGENTTFYSNIMRTVHRFVDPSGGDITNGRVGIWEDYLTVFFKDIRFFFLGTSKRSWYSQVEAHNIFLDIFTRYGLIGFFVVSWVYAAVFIEIANSIKRYGNYTASLIGLLPFVMVFFMGIASSLSLLTTNPTVNFCMGAAMVYLFGEPNDEVSLFVGKKERRKTKRLLYNGRNKK